MFDGFCWYVELMERMFQDDWMNTLNQISVVKQQ